MRREAITLPSAARGYGERSCDPESALRVGLGFCPVGEPAATAPRSGRLETDSAGRAAADEETTLLASFRGCTKQSARLPLPTCCCAMSLSTENRTGSMYGTRRLERSAG
jgi:hypothetical protein